MAASGCGQGKEREFRSDVAGAGNEGGDDSRAGTGGGSGGSKAGGTDAGGTAAGATGAGAGAGGTDAGMAGMGGAPPMEEECPDGTWDHDGTTTTACQSWSRCQPGQYESEPGTPTTDRGCTGCGAETFSTKQNALMCDAWSVCEPGQHVQTPGATSSDRVCRDCSAGSFSDDQNLQSCTGCTPGTYAPAGSSECQDWTTCSPGTFVSTPGSATQNRACSPCPADTQSTQPNQSECLPVGACAAGTVQTAPATENMPAVCAPCAPGNHCPGGTSPKVACASGTWDHDANSATECIDKTTCQPGQYISASGNATTDRTCATCTAGSASSSTNSASCTSCAAGKFSAAGASSCTSCAAGSFSAAGASSCTACSAGSYAAAGASSCTTCSASTWDDDQDPASACVNKTNCQPGQYVSAPGDKVTDRACTSCAAGSVSASTNASSCTTCPAGKFSAAGASSCSTCAAGTYSAANAPSCTACAAGKYSAAGASSCTTCAASCAAGTYQATACTATTNRTCTACANGSYSTTTDAPSCTTCTACGTANGTYETAACSATTNRVCTAFPSCLGLASSCGASSNDQCCKAPTVTGGDFTMGSATAGNVSSFALDKYEVTVGRFRKFVEAYAGHPANNAGAHPLIANSGWQSPSWDSSIAADKAALTTAVQCNATNQTWNGAGANDFLPMNCVSWFEAFAFCAWDGARLPTEAEWEYAAKGGDAGRAYPWGNSPAPSNAQDSTAAYATYNCLGDGSAGASCAFADILRAGSKSSGAGLYGQLDLAGSMWEWNLDWSNTLPASCDDCANLTGSPMGQPPSRVLRGGAWDTTAGGLPNSYRSGNITTNHAANYGFRCARSVP